MELAVFGVNHVSAPLPVREALYLNAERMAEFLSRWRRDLPDDQLVGLCTCNRTELYCFSPAPRDSLRATIAARVAAATTADINRFIDHTYFHTGATAVAHLFRVASGVDSMVIGESQILSQLRQAYALAREAGGTAGLLNNLMDRALRVGKRVRTETEIGMGNLSVASVAVGLASRVFNNLSRHTVLLLGAGETGELTARHLLEAGVRDLRVANRTPERAVELAKRLVYGKAVPFEPLFDQLLEADIVMCATGAEKPIITAPMARDLMNRRGGRLLVFLDLSVPRNVDPAVEAIEQVIAYDVDSLQAICNQGREKRKAEIVKVEAIIENEVEKFREWYARLEADSLLTALRRRFDDIRRQEIERYGKKFLPEDQDRLDQFTQSLSNKLLHDLTMNLRQVNRDSRDGLALLDAVDQLFGLSDRRDDGKEDE